MLKFTLRNRWHKGLGFASWLLGFVSVVVAAALRADVAVWEQRSQFIGEILRRNQDNAWWFLPTLMALVGTAQLGKRFVGPPIVWSTLKAVLDLFREHTFGTIEDDPVHFHRVTLFKHRRFAFTFSENPFGGRLVPFERSGHTTRVCRSKFRAPDDADKCEGIAGRTWATGKPVRVAGLPDTLSGADVELQAYADATYMTVEDVRRLRPKARSYLGLPVEVGGRVWGVIVLDSRGVDTIDDGAIKTYRIVAKVLGKLLEKA